MALVLKKGKGPRNVVDKLPTRASDDDMKHVAKQRDTYCIGPAFPGGPAAYDFVPARCVRRRAAPSGAGRRPAASLEVRALREVLTSEAKALNALADAKKKQLSTMTDAKTGRNALSSAVVFKQVSALQVPAMRAFVQHVALSGHASTSQRTKLFADRRLLELCAASDAPRGSQELLAVQMMMARYVAAYATSVRSLLAAKKSI